MNRFLLLALAVPALFLSACDDNNSVESRDSYADAGNARSAKMMGGSAPMMASAPMMESYAAVTQAAPPSSMVMDRTQLGQRKIAETHALQIQTRYDLLQERYQRDFKKCVELGCQITNSNLQLEQGGNINARIDPEKLGVFLDFLAEGEGKILNHAVSADDYTMEYTDRTAATENLLALRNRLATLLNSRAQNVADILRIEQELNRIQTQIDQNTARLKIIATMTDMATVNIGYQVEYRPAGIKPYELKNTWSRAAQKFLMGIDRMIQTVFAALPWLPVLGLSIWFGIWVVRLAVGKTSIRWPWRRKP